MSTPHTPITWFCAQLNNSEEWEFGGAARNDAINTGFDLWGGSKPMGDGFWIAPAHETTPTEKDEGMEFPFYIETEKSEWFPLT